MPEGARFDLVILFGHGFGLPSQSTCFIYLGVDQVVGLGFSFLPSEPSSGTCLNLPKVLDHLHYFDLELGLVLPFDCFDPTLTITASEFGLDSLQELIVLSSELLDLCLVLDLFDPRVVKELFLLSSILEAPESDLIVVPFLYQELLRLDDA